MLLDNIRLLFSESDEMYKNSVSWKDSFDPNSRSGSQYFNTLSYRQQTWLEKNTFNVKYLGYCQFLCIWGFLFPAGYLCEWLLRCLCHDISQRGVEEVQLTHTEADAKRRRWTAPSPCLQTSRDPLHRRMNEH